MSESGVTRLLLIILIITCARKGTSLECYVCTSVDDAACTSSLSGIELSTCTSDESSNSSSTTVTSGTTTVLSESTTTLDSATEVTSITDSSTSSTSADTTSTAQDSTSDPATTLETTTSYANSTQEDSSSTILQANTNSTSESTEAGATLAVTSEATTTEETTQAVIDASRLASVLESENNEPVVRVARAADESFACYTLTLIKDGVTVTDRGCVVQSTSMCETLNEELYPSHNLSTCTTCTKDGCNSSPINLSGIQSVLYPFIMFILTR